MVDSIPQHIAIIPDGNRRWAKSKGLQKLVGVNKAGKYSSLKRLFDEAKNLGVKYFSIWGFSTENWNRSKYEINEVFKIVLNGIKDFRKDCVKEKIKFVHVGRKERLPKDLVDELKKLEGETKDFTDFCVLICVDYGGRDEIVRAVRKIIDAGKNKIDEEDFLNYLDTKEIPDLDLIIRTGGENRLSGFMLYQSAYAELYFTKKYFPDFAPEDLREAIAEFSRRKRTFGGD